MCVDYKPERPRPHDRSGVLDPHDFANAGAARFAELGDLNDGIDQAAFGIAPLLEWAERDEREGAEPPVDPED